MGISLEQAAGLAQPCGPAVMCGVCGWRRGMLRTPQMKNHLANVSSAKQREFYQVWSHSVGWQEARSGGGGPRTE